MEVSDRKIIQAKINEIRTKYPQVKDQLEKKLDKYSKQDVALIKQPASKRHTNPPEQDQNKRAQIIKSGLQLLVRELIELAEKNKLTGFDQATHKELRAIQPTEGETSLWDLANNGRGRLAEALFIGEGVQRKAPNAPIMDLKPEIPNPEPPETERAKKELVWTSIKTININAPSYEAPGKMISKWRSFVSKAEDFGKDKKKHFLPDETPLKKYGIKPRLFIIVPSKFRLNDPRKGNQQPRKVSDDDKSNVKSNKVDVEVKVL